MLESADQIPLDANTWTVLDMPRLAANIESIAAAAGDLSKLILVVKSDAYGHGLDDVVRCAWEAGVRRFAVAHARELARLRVLLPDVWVLLVGVVLPGQVADVAAARGRVAITSMEHAEALSHAAAVAGVELRSHLKVDTGMGRLGIAWRDAEACLNRIAALPGLAVEGLFTHFAQTAPDEDTYASQQMERFRGVVTVAESVFGAGLMRHVSNSDAFVCRHDWDLDGFRVGLLAYGYRGVAAPRNVETGPCLEWQTRVLQVKTLAAGESVGYGGTYRTQAPTRIATLDVGYADGYLRCMGNRAHVLIAGRRCRVVGRVSMNLVTVEVPTDAELRIGDVATLLGVDGDAAVQADELAAAADTVPYEILTCIRPGHRSHRLHGT